MGVNDELTPREHDEIRGTLLAGAGRIKPVGAHRMQLIAASVALVLVGGVAGGAIAAGALFGSAEPVDSPSPTVSATPTQTPTRTPTPTATPTEEPVVPRVVLDGDCGRLLGPDALDEIIGDDAVAVTSAHSAFNGYSDLTASAALLGAIRCGWSSAGGEWGIEVSVYPLAAVAQNVRDSYATSRCFMTQYCDSGREIGGFWVNAAVRPETSDGNFSALQSDADAVAAMIFDRVAPGLVGASAVGVPREPTWWTVSDCGALTPTVESAAGRQLEPVYPGDAIPEGVEWDLLVAAGLEQWCPWNGASESGIVMIEFFAQPGVGAPDPAQLGDAVPIDVVGADAAWYVASESFESDFTVVAVSGPNRLMLRYRDSTRPDFDANAVAALAQRLIEQLG